ncbi:MAG: 30S ribosomal protein S16 [Chloroflexi bacterium CG08_land_8_20_14_0_20_45_12]|nr:MAG: 30S ribosomal protein S16 [Chloroflexi bacterium CG08_land_8_20_14_0_20_45_12]
MVKIRLRRVGAKNKPAYRVVVADSHSARNGAFIEIIGHYNPLTEPATIHIDEEKALEWLKRGAQTTDTVCSLFRKLGIMDKFKLQSPELNSGSEPKSITRGRGSPSPQHPLSGEGQEVE